MAVPAAMRSLVLAAALGVTQAHLLAHYRLADEWAYANGVVSDSSGDSARTATMVGGTTNCGVREDGRFGYGMFFSDACYVSVPSAISDVIDGSAARSICAWARIDADAMDTGGSESRVTCAGGYGCYGALFSQGGSSGTTRGDFSLRPGDVVSTRARDYWRVNLWSDDVVGLYLDGSMDGQWHHYCLTYDGATTVTLFYDGAAARTHATQAALETESTPVSIGRNNNDGDYLAGSVDEVAIFSHALTDAQVLAMVRGGGDGRVGRFAMDNIPGWDPASLYGQGQYVRLPGQLSQGKETKDACVAACARIGARLPCPVDAADAGQLHALFDVWGDSNGAWVDAHVQDGGTSWGGGWSQASHKCAGWRADDSLWMPGEPSGDARRVSPT